jgi:hypothetical protein
MNEARTLPLWKSAFEKLVTADTFGYGFLIKHEWMEGELQLSRNTAQYEFEVLEMRNAFKERGFILTSRGTNGEGYRVATKAEMAQIVAGQERQKLHHTFRNHTALAQVDVTDMGDLERKRHEHWTGKTGLLFAIAQKLMRMRKLPDSPEMAVKTLKQIH